MGAGRLNIINRISYQEALGISLTAPSKRPILPFVLMEQGDSCAISIKICNSLGSRTKLLS